MSISLSRSFIAIVTTLAGGLGAYTLSRTAPPRFENATSVRITRVENAQCYDPRTGHYPCLEAFVVVLYPSTDGHIWSVSTSYKLDGTLINGVQQDFGAATPVALRQLEGALAAARVDPDANVRDRAERLARDVADTRRYDVESDARIPFRIERVVDQIARRHYEATHHRMTITSGSRDADKQARAMYDKLRLGDDILRLYHDQMAAREIKNAYESATGRPADEVITAMTNVIRAQMARGVYISKHLKDGAVDVRITDMRPDEADDFRGQIAESDQIEIGLEETKPPHFHLELSTPRAPLP